MRILHLIGTVSEAAGGPPRSVAALADAQVERGHDVVIVAAADRSGAPVKPKRARLETYGSLFGDPRAPSIGAAVRAVRLMRDADVVHAHGLWMQPTLVALAARRHGAKLLVSPRGMLSPQALAQRALRKRVRLALVEREVLARADAVVATSDAEADDLRALGIDRVAVVPNGIAAVARARHAHRGPSIGFVGRLVPFKRVDLLVRALAHLPEHTLHIGGDGEASERESLRALAASLGVAARVRFAGWLDDANKRAFLDDVSALALVSRSENFGVSVLEGLAAGLPCVVTPNLPWRTDAGDAVVVSGNDGDRAIADALAAATSVARYDTRSEAALALARRYAWPSIAARIDELIA